MGIRDPLAVRADLSALGAANAPHGFFERPDTWRTCARRRLSLEAAERLAKRSSRCSAQSAWQCKVSEIFEEPPAGIRSHKWPPAAQHSDSPFLEGLSGRQILSHRLHFESRLLKLPRSDRSQCQAGERRCELQLWRWETGPCFLEGWATAGTLRGGTNLSFG
jgi:hypothetical protein